MAIRPLWFFYRGRSPGRKLERLRGKRLSIGPEGSGTRDLAVTLLAANGIDRGVARLLPCSSPPRPASWCGRICTPRSSTSCSTRRRIFRLYGELKFLEEDLDRRDSGEDAGDLTEPQEQLEARANRLQVPLAYTNQLYNLRRDIQMVRERLAGRRPSRAR